MHYIYGACSACKGSTYRWSTESFYRHLDGSRADSECESLRLESEK